MHVAAIQLPVRMNVKVNVRQLQAAMSELPPHTLAVAPEGCLSGYLPQPGFVVHLDNAATTSAIEQVREAVAKAQLHLVVGACINVEGVWRNSSIYMGPAGQVWRYDKINLAQSERGDFTPGDNLPLIDLVISGRQVRLGVQMCREIRYPEQWRYLAMQGAEVIAYVNNAIGSLNGHDLWRAHVISRAAENQRFVISANNAALDQNCTSLIVAPSGAVVAEAKVGETVTIQAQIDLAEVSNWIIGQSRNDVVSVVSTSTVSRG